MMIPAMTAYSIARYFELKFIFLSLILRWFLVPSLSRSLSYLILWAAGDCSLTELDARDSFWDLYL